MAFVVKDEGLIKTLLREAGDIIIETCPLLYIFAPVLSWLHIWKFSFGVMGGFVVFTLMVSRAGDWLDLNMLESIKMFWDNEHVGVFKLPMFEGSDNTTVVHTVACLVESMA